MNAARQAEVNTLLQLAISSNPSQPTTISHIPGAFAQDVIDVAWQVCGVFKSPRMFSDMAIESR